MDRVIFDTDENVTKLSHFRGQVGREPDRILYANHVTKNVVKVLALLFRRDIDLKWLIVILRTSFRPEEVICYFMVLLYYPEWIYNGIWIFPALSPNRYCMVMKG